MNDTDITYHDGQWWATGNGVTASGVSPEEAATNLEKLGAVTLAKPVEEDWIDPYNLPPTKNMHL